MELLLQVKMPSVLMLTETGFLPSMEHAVLFYATQHSPAILQALANLNSVLALGFDTTEEGWAFIGAVDQSLPSIYRACLVAEKSFYDEAKRNVIVLEHIPGVILVVTLNDNIIPAREMMGHQVREFFELGFYRV